MALKDLIKSSNQKSINLNKDNKNQTLAEKIAKTDQILGINDEVLKKVEHVNRLLITLPLADVELLNKIIERFLRLNKAVNKSEVIRLGLKIIDIMDDQYIIDKLGLVPKLKAGKPKKT